MELHPECFEVGLYSMRDGLAGISAFLESLNETTHTSNPASDGIAAACGMISMAHCKAKELVEQFEEQDRQEREEKYGKSA